MSAEQNPPVTVITVPSDTAPASTAPTTTVTTSQETSSTSRIDTVTPTTSAPASTATSIGTAVPTAGEGNPATVNVLFGLGGLVVVVLVVVAWRRFRRRAAPPVVLPGGATLTERVREAVARAEHEEPVEHMVLGDVSVADLYPWIEPPEDLTLVVDLRTAEALQEVGVTSLADLADMDDDTVRSMIDAGIDINTRAVEAAARDILNNRRRDAAD